MRYVKLAVLAAAAVLLAVVLAQPAHAEVSFDFAYSNLSHHGSWLVSTQYGRVWQPSVYNREWNPYYDGHWVYTDMGWTWVSDYEWGAIPYHYGTWVADQDAGWVWIPGEVWAPSWVVFRTDSDYIGWAPVPPGYSVGMTIDVREPSNFVFVSSRDFLAPRVRMSIIPRDRTNVFINKTTIVNNIVIQNNVVINRGPDFKIVERATGHPIREARIESVARVAPFEHVSRAQLAVDPARVKKGLRVAEVVPASRPLPESDKGGARERKAARTEAAQTEAAQTEATRTEAAQTEASKPRNKRPAARPSTQEPATPSAAVMPGRAADTEKKARRAQTPSREATAASSTEARSRAEAKPRPREQPEGDVKQSPKAQPEANVKADAKQSPRAQRKAKAEAKAKKDNPDKKGQSSDKGTESKDGTHK